MDVVVRLKRRKTNMPKRKVKLDLVPRRVMYKGSKFYVTFEERTFNQLVKSQEWLKAGNRRDLIKDVLRNQSTIATYTNPNIGQNLT